MVLQSGEGTVIFGAQNATVPGDVITLTTSVALDNGSTWTAVAKNDGSWSITLPVLAPSNKPISITAASSKTGANKTLSNVLVGAVIICAGQSNMALYVKNAWSPSTLDNILEESKSYADIRLLK
jgi:hypothetical protein